jgi:ABC-type bacteriocin/lantibiotic exporter with double-glycine peptidase domain
MVLAYYGKLVPVGEIRDVMRVSRDGVNAASFLRVARQYGLRGRAVKIELEALGYLPRAAVLHWDFTHFVVFERLCRRGVEIVDPSLGRYVVPMEQFRRSFTGVAVLLEPGGAFQPQRNERRLVQAYASHLVTHSGLLTRILAMSVLLQVFALSVPVLTGALVDRVVPSADYDLLHLLGFGVIAIVCFHGLASWIRSHLLLHLRTRIDAHMTLGFLEHLVALPYNFFQQRSDGDLMMRVNSLAVIREILTSSTLAGLLDGALVTAYLVILLLTNVSMGLLVVALALLQVAVFSVYYRRYRELMARELWAHSRTQGFLVQMLAGIETLKASGAEDRAVEQCSNLFVDGLNVSLMRGRLSAATDSMLAALRMGSPLVVMWFGAVQVLNGPFSLGTMLAFTAIATGFLGPISTLVTTALQIQLLRSYIERLDDVFRAAPEQDWSRVTKPGALSGRIDVDNVTFTYGASTSDVVTNVSLHLAPGQKVAIVGRSGAGKSTLGRLILALYRPSCGRILYDGADLARLDLPSVRSQLGIVTQRSHLFDGTIRGNIALSDSGIPFSDVVEAAKLACIHDDILQMPMGYDTVISDGGACLSGGQRQRLGLARALVRRPAILVLDEGTSELDTVTEQQVQHNLAALRCTSIVIAHRLSTVTDADLIVVMDHGQVVEQGTHRELMQRHGTYVKLMAAQVASLNASAC